MIRSYVTQGRYHDTTSPNVAAGGLAGFLDSPHGAARHDGFHPRPLHHHSQFPRSTSPYILVNTPPTTKSIPKERVAVSHSGWLKVESRRLHSAIRPAWFCPSYPYRGNRIYCVVATRRHLGFSSTPMKRFLAGRVHFALTFDLSRRAYGT